jgi:hypothetical protein
MVCYSPPFRQALRGRGSGTVQSELLIWQRVTNRLGNVLRMINVRTRRIRTTLNTRMEWTTDPTRRIRTTLLMRVAVRATKPKQKSPNKPAHKNGKSSHAHQCKRQEMTKPGENLQSSACSVTIWACILDELGLCSWRFGPVFSTNWACVRDDLGLYSSRIGPVFSTNS